MLQQLLHLLEWYKSMGYLPDDLLIIFSREAATSITDKVGGLPAGVKMERFADIQVEIDMVSDTKIGFCLLRKRDRLCLAFVQGHPKDAPHPFYKNLFQ